MIKRSQDLAFGDVVEVSDRQYFVREVVIVYPGEVIVAFSNLGEIPNYDDSYGTILAADTPIVVV